MKKYLLGYGVPLRSRDLKVAQRFGESDAHPGEAKVIQKLKQLRDQGLSYRKIVNAMNELEISCRNSGARWQLKTVFNYLNRA